jgi:hypothetical protein
MRRDFIYTSSGKMARSSRIARGLDGRRQHRRRCANTHFSGRPRQLFAIWSPGGVAFTDQKVTMARW